MPVSDELRSRILATRELLEAERRPCGVPHIVRYLREERPAPLSAGDESALFDAGWKAEVGRAVRGIATTGGARTILSAPGEEGRSYKQLGFIFLVDALGILQMYESSERAFRLQRNGWWNITERLRAMPEGSTVADIFPNEEKWDRFWDGVKAADLWQDAA